MRYGDSAERSWLFPGTRRLAAGSVHEYVLSDRLGCVAGLEAELMALATCSRN